MAGEGDSEHTRCFGELQRKRREMGRSDHRVKGDLKCEDLVHVLMAPKKKKKKSSEGSS